MINFKSIKLRAIVALCAFGLAGAAYADPENAPQEDAGDAVEEKAPASVSNDDSAADSATADDGKKKIVTLHEEAAVQHDKKRKKTRMVCREHAPTGTRFKQRRCVTEEQWKMEQEQAKKLTRGVRGNTRTLQSEPPPPPPR